MNRAMKLDRSHWWFEDYAGVAFRWTVLLACMAAFYLLGFVRGSAPDEQLRRECSTALSTWESAREAEMRAAHEIDFQQARARWLVTQSVVLTENRP